MQPFLIYLIAEAALFYVAVAGDIYLTDNLVKWFGPSIEANGRVRAMYEVGNLKRSYLAILSVIPLYLALAGFGEYVLLPYAPLAVVLAGLILPGISIWNTVSGSMTFYRMKKLRS